MKVKVLKALLNHVPDDYDVILSRDEEGNGFAPVEAVGFGKYQDREFIDDSELESSEAPSAICLWP